MKLRVPLVDGTELVFEGERDELVATAEKFVEKAGSVVAMKGKGVQPPSTLIPIKNNANQNGQASRRWNEQSCRKLWGNIYGEQAKLVKYLVENGGVATYGEIEKKMGYKGQHLSGILSPLTRNSQTATNDRLARLVDWRVIKTGIREYYIDSEALPFLKELIK
jgi:hypothetical protein